MGNNLAGPGRRSRSNSQPHAVEYYHRLAESQSVLSQLSKAARDNQTGSVTNGGRHQIPNSTTLTSQLDFCPQQDLQVEKSHTLTAATASPQLPARQQRRCVTDPTSETTSPQQAEKLKTLVRQRQEDATETMDWEFVLQEAPQRVSVKVRLITLVCCSQKTVWVFRSEGLRKLGQIDLLMVLEHLAMDSGVPPDIIQLFSGVLKKAKEGEIVGDLDHTVFQPGSGFLGSAFIGGVLYFMESGQCFHGLVNPADFGSLLVCRLVHTRELPYLMHAPLRLLLRLGEEEGVYPCSLISHRYRPALFHDPSRSVYSMFKEVLGPGQGMIPRLRECSITLEQGSGHISVSIARKRQSELVSLLRLYSPDADGVLAIGGELCQFADAHLVAKETPGVGGASQQLQQQQQVGLETALFSAKTVSKPTVTGLSFIAVASHLPGRSVGLSGNVAAVVEDGVAVTCRREDMKSLLSSLTNAIDYTMTVDWLFAFQRKKAQKKCHIKFIWRLKPGL